jgi:fatty acyl-CoA reductase
VINADVSLNGLGLNAQDENELINNVDIVFHLAASTKFNNSLKEAININTTGTLRMLQLAEKMKQLQVFLHVSTTFINNQLLVEERYYDSKLDPFEIIEASSHLEDEENLKLYEANL